MFRLIGLEGLEKHGQARRKDCAVPWVLRSRVPSILTPLSDLPGKAQGPLCSESPNCSPFSPFSGMNPAPYGIHILVLPVTVTWGLSHVVTRSIYPPAYILAPATNLGSKSLSLEWSWQVWGSRRESG